MHQAFQGFLTLLTTTLGVLLAPSEITARELARANAAPQLRIRVDWAAFPGAGHAAPAHG